MKLLVIPKNNPKWTIFLPPENFNRWYWGRELRDYILIKFAEKGDDFKDKILNLENSDIQEAQKEINVIFNLKEIV